MKTIIFSTLSILIFATPAFSADYVFQTKTCGNKFTLTFSTSSTANITKAFKPSSLERCTSWGTPRGVEDSGCRSSVVIGKTYSYQVELGSLRYSNDLGQSSSTPVSIILYGNVLDNSGITPETATYGWDMSSGPDQSLNPQANSLWGDGIFETSGMPLDSLPEPQNVHKSGNTFTGLAGYLDGVLKNDPGVTVWTKDCPNTVVAFKR